MSLDKEEKPKPPKKRPDRKPPASDPVEITRIISQTVGGIAALIVGAYLILHGQTAPGYLTLGAGLFVIAPNFVSSVIRNMIERYLKEEMKRLSNRDGDGDTDDGTE